MKKSITLLVASAITLLAVSPAFSQAAKSSDNKVVKGAKAVGRGVMWAPKKIGHGLKEAGSKTKKTFTGK
jgi:hypothetical protein